MASTHAAQQTGLIRTIGRWSLVALAINSVIGSGVFGLPAIVAGLLGAYSIFAVLLAGAAMGAVMLCFAEVASQFTEAGGPYLYARTAFGRLIGILVGWLFYLAVAAATAANVNLFVIYLAEFWPGARESLSRLVILTVVIGVLTVINLMGVRQGTTASNIFTVAKIFPLLMVVFAGTAMIVFGTAAVPMLRAHPSSGAWLKATVLMAFLFGGFESALIPVGEAEDPRRDAPFALLATLISCTAIYALIQWVVVEVLGSSATTDRSLAEVARVTMGKNEAALIAIGAMVSVYGLLSAKLLAMPRLTFALAEQGDLPRIFCAVNRQFHTPWFSILSYAAVIWILASIGSFTWNVTLSVIARLFYYGVICAAVIALRRKQPEAATFRLPAGPVFALLGLAVCVILATQADLSQSKIVAAAVLAAIANWVWARRTSERQAAAHTSVWPHQK